MEMARRQLGLQTGIWEHSSGWRYGFVGDVQLMKLAEKKMQRRAAELAKESCQLKTAHLPHGGPTVTLKSTMGLWSDSMHACWHRQLVCTDGRSRGQTLSVALAFTLHE